ncbi:starch phosphorylase [Alkalithermobacter thermoalcaliphilus JW-YL-7 = DSM 7308]|uniref:Alpha-1,4 glucan phosphorylase n=1 Tax=Alkalithermobacter thermoalcaliphilus JW-YL-7 = DSM 7308 TaxID=1121328 RepID=A0A150FQ55_CLOPD|nr:glycogen/starch/alpha-glucan phosphorylase [[Clostridium] paradoxum JW-YL-7 = DSM 7308]SHK62134.1 starch phosphorylase [[Clostridium] paradoxum JW-YL-7 = DSM 7308]
MNIIENEFKQSYIRSLKITRGKSLCNATTLDKYLALCNLIREYIFENWVKTNEIYEENSEKQVYYFSMEFLMGKLLVSNLINLGIKDICENALKELNISLNELEEFEDDMGLGNGGLGRLAACFLDSMASIDVPGHGIGIRYNYGFFKQKIVNGYQIEHPDYWLEKENPWEVKRQDEAIRVKFYGNVKMEYKDNKLVFIHQDYESVLAIPYDVPIVGYKNNKVNTLRLWSVKAEDEFDYHMFSRGEYHRAVENKLNAEAICNTLYPDDSHEKGKLLRLKQEYFLVCAGVKSIVNQYKKLGKDLTQFHKHIAIHINDTHPSLAIPELMRILIDEEGLGWDQAWEITKNTISYTNHTIMSEALEKWDINLFKKLLPRIFMIIEEIDRRFRQEIKNTKNTSIISDNNIKMANLSIIGSHSVNGVAQLHTEILKKKELKDFYIIYPNKFNNKTNGIAHRRWLLKCNPLLADLISQTIGTEWICDPIRLVDLAKFKKDSYIKEKLDLVKRNNKLNLSKLISRKNSINIDPDSIFDVQIKRIHEYKRQTLNIFNVIHLYNTILENPNLDIHPRTFIFSGKAAPGYFMAKKIIKLINTVADKINNDKRVKDKIKVVFMEDYSVSLAEKIIPACDVSEQISTTTKEASGTGNMKFMMNGAITIATLDGANIEIAKAVGEDNIVLFGIRAKEFYDLQGSYNCLDIYNNDLRVKKVLDSLVNGFLTQDHLEFEPLYSSIIKNNDQYFILKDFNSYINAQNKIDKLYKNKDKWLEMAVVNIAHSGIFSSDNTIYEYAKEIWNVSCR